MTHCDYVLILVYTSEHSVFVSLLVCSLISLAQMLKLQRFGIAARWWQTGKGVMQVKYQLRPEMKI